MTRLSFSGKVKRELCREEPAKRRCALAELYGVLLYCNNFSRGEVRIVTESAAFANHLPWLLKEAFQISFDQIPAPGGRGKRTLSVTDPAKLEILWEACGYDSKRSLAHHINFAMLEEEHCRAAFLRGVFLAGGSVTDPTKGYHLEMVTTHLHVSRELSALLIEMGFFPKDIVRKSNYVTYFKQSEYIEDFLTLIGAPLAAMEIMNAKVEKNLRGSINRRVNCDAANLDKTVDAAQGQLAAIRALEAAFVLEGLSDKLRQTAALRMEYPELTLSQLAELCDPPVTKSCLNHRLRKLVKLGREISR